VLSGVHDTAVLSCRSASGRRPGIGSWLPGRRVFAGSVPAARPASSTRRPPGRAPAGQRFGRGHGGYLLPLARSPDC
ncbi:MAG: hypothetical protein ACE5F1_14240, partial [Planctomycetota bacterium]